MAASRIWPEARSIDPPDSGARLSSGAARERNPWSRRPGIAFGGTAGPPPLQASEAIASTPPPN